MPSPDKLSRSVLRRDAASPPDAESALDQRIVRFENAVVAFDNREQYIKAIGSLWRRAQSAFIQIGQYLELAKERLPHGEYWAMIESDLPFSPQTAAQIRAAARAITSGRLAKDRLPASYTTVYLLSTLDDEALRAADQQGLIRPDVRRSEIMAFKRSLAPREIDDLAPIRAARERLLRQRAQIDMELAELDAKLARAQST